MVQDNSIILGSSSSCSSLEVLERREARVNVIPLWTCPSLFGDELHASLNCKSEILGCLQSLDNKISGIVIDWRLHMLWDRYCNRFSLTHESTERFLWKTMSFWLCHSIHPILYGTGLLLINFKSTFPFSIQPIMLKLSSKTWSLVSFHLAMIASFHTSLIY